MKNLTAIARTLAAVLSVTLALAACGRDLGTAQGVAEEFVEQHYVNIDLAKAKALTVSLAQHKIDEELRLTAGQKIDASTHKPRITYELLEKKENPKRSTFLYQGTIYSDDGTSFGRKWLVTTRLESDRWRVSNFSEFD